MKETGNESDSLPRQGMGVVVVVVVVIIFVTVSERIIWTLTFCLPFCYWKNCVFVSTNSRGDILVSDWCAHRGICFSGVNGGGRKAITE